MDQLAAIRLFIAAADGGSLAAGGRATGRSRDQASRLVAQLEAALGLPLFVRSTRALTLTAAGSEYLDRVRLVVEDLDDASTRAKGLFDRPYGPLRVNAPMMFGTLWLAPLVPEFLSLFPDVGLDLSLDDRLIKLPAPGLDLVLRLAETPGIDLAAEKIGTIGRALYAAPSFLKQNGEPQSPRELERYACLHYGYLATGSEWVLYGPEGAVDRVHIRGPLVSNNGVILSQAALAGHGLILLPDFVAEPLRRDGHLQRVLPDWEPPPISLFALSPPLNSGARKLRAFVDFVASRFKGTHSSSKGKATRAKPAGPRPSRKP